MQVNKVNLGEKIMSSITNGLKFLISCTILSVTFSTKIFADEKLHQVLVSQAITESGIEQQFVGFDEIISNTMTQIFALDNKLTDIEKNKLTEILVSNYNHTDFMKEIHKSLSYKLSDEDLRGKLDLYNLPLVKKFIQAEKNNAQPQVQQKLAGFALKLNRNPPATERLELVNRLDKATHASEYVKNLMINMFTTLIYGVNDLNHKLTNKELEDAIKAYKLVINSAVSKEVAVSILYTYQDLTNSELEQYIAIHEENKFIVDKFNRALMSATNEYFNGYTTRIAKGLAMFIVDKQQVELA